MSLSSSSSSSSSASSTSSARPRSSWLQVVLLTVLVYILLFSTACCHAVPVWKTSPQQLSSMTTDHLNEDVPSVADDIPVLRMGEGDFDNPDSILERCLQATGEGKLEENVLVKTLCTLAMINSQHGKASHQGFAKRGVPSDHSSFSAFSRLVSTLRRHASDVADYQNELNRLQAQGILDADYNIISLPSSTRNLMKQLG